MNRLDARDDEVDESLLGSIILEVVPQVSALSTRSLASHCSYCHAEEGASSSGTTPNALKRCTLCKVVWYDTTVRPCKQTSRHTRALLSLDSLIP